MYIYIKLNNVLSLQQIKLCSVHMLLESFPLQDIKRTAENMKCRNELNIDITKTSKMDKKAFLNIPGSEFIKIWNSPF